VPNVLMRTRILAVALFVFGAMWLVAAATKIASPLPAYELTAQAVPPGLHPKVVLAALVAAEVCLGAAMCLRALKGLGWSLVALALASAVLVVLKQRAEEQLIPCGCFGKLFNTSLEGALVRNAIVGAVHVALILWNRLAKRA
jgi:hypothetical protein